MMEGENLFMRNGMMEQWNNGRMEEWKNGRMKTFQVEAGLCGGVPRRAG